MYDLRIQCALQRQIQETYQVVKTFDKPWLFEMARPRKKGEKKRLHSESASLLQRRCPGCVHRKGHERPLLSPFGCNPLKHRISVLWGRAMLRCEDDRHGVPLTKTHLAVTSQSTGPSPPSFPFSNARPRARVSWHRSIATRISMSKTSRTCP